MPWLCVGPLAQRYIKGYIYPRPSGAITAMDHLLFFSFKSVMHSKSAFLLIVVAVSTTAMVHGHPAASTPAARFWEQALSGTPMPEVLADFVQKGNLCLHV